MGGICYDSANNSYWCGACVPLPGPPCDVVNESRPCDDAGNVCTYVDDDNGTFADGVRFGVARLACIGGVQSDAGTGAGPCYAPPAPDGGDAAADDGGGEGGDAGLGDAAGQVAPSEAGAMDGGDSGGDGGRGDGGAGADAGLADAARQVGSSDATVIDAGGSGTDAGAGGGGSGADATLADASNENGSNDAGEMEGGIPSAAPSKSGCSCGVAQGGNANGLAVLFGLAMLLGARNRSLRRRGRAY